MKEIETLGNLLVDSIRKTCDKKEIGLVYSAGVDSTIIGTIASKFSKVRAYTVGIKNSDDMTVAREICRDVPFDTEMIEITRGDIENSIPEILHILGEPNPVKTAVAVPFHFASKKAREEGLETMLCGQGADELFGGYRRYVDALSQGSKTVEDMMRKDIREIYEKQLDYDKAVCRHNKMELKFPYMDSNIVEYVLEIPLELKIREVVGEPEFQCVDETDGKKVIRKYLLRKIAENIHTPELIINRRKKAAQYGSGVQKTLDRIARARGFKEKAREVGRKDYNRMYLEESLHHG